MYTTTFDEVKKVWSGPESTVQTGKYKNFGEFLLEKLAGADCERVMQINGDTDEGITKAEVRSRTIQCAKNLIKLGCTLDQRIAIIARNHHNLTPLMFAALCVGAPISPLDIGTVQDGISPILRRLEPLLIFCDADVLIDVKNICSTLALNVKLFTVNGCADGFDSIDTLMSGTDTGTDDDFVCTEIKDMSSHAALLACSSGSTGLPKSICMSHTLLFKTFFSGADLFEFVMLCFSSMYWFSGIWVMVVSSFRNTRIFTSKPFSVDLFFDLVAKYKVQCFSGPPCELQNVLKSDRSKTDDLSTLGLHILLGGHIPTVLVQSSKEILPKSVIITAYGLTEIGGGATLTAPTDLEQFPGSVGCLVPGTSIKLIDELTGKECGIGEKGEICVKLSIPSMGYFRDDEANRNAFDADGYFKSGDIGYFDESGRLYVSGRKKEIFKNRGYAIWPAEIEDVLLKNHAIRNVCVTPVFDEDMVSELPAAVVIKNESNSITRDEVYAIVADQMASYKRLDGGVYFVNEFPMTPSGKVIRSKVKEMAQKFYESKKNENKQNVNKL